MDGIIAGGAGISRWSPKSRAQGTRFYACRSRLGQNGHQDKGIVRAFFVRLTRRRDVRRLNLVPSCSGFAAHSVARPISACATGHIVTAESSSVMVAFGEKARWL